MMRRRSRSTYGVKARRKHIIRVVTAAGIFGLLAAAPVLVFMGWKNGRGNEKQELVESWGEGAYTRTFELSQSRLQEKPMDYFLLVLNGFSAYQLAVAQINNAGTQLYIDACIWSLRKALLCKEGARGDPRVSYVLGKAYYYKGASYADLAVTYLEAARAAGYEAPDIPEYLGLAYAAIHDYRNSVAAFSLALNAGAESEPVGVPAEIPAEISPDTQARPLEIVYTRNTGDTGALPSDLLLLSIARSYTALEEYDAARAYLVRCLEISKDSNTRAAVRLLLGEILAKMGNPSAAEAQYLTLLEEYGDNADAHYQLGELYAAEGDKYKARAELRRALRVNPAHGPAQTLLTRLNM